MYVFVIYFENFQFFFNIFEFFLTFEQLYKTTDYIKGGPKKNVSFEMQ